MGYKIFVALASLLLACATPKAERRTLSITINVSCGSQILHPTRVEVFEKGDPDTLFVDVISRTGIVKGRFPSRSSELALVFTSLPTAVKRTHFLKVGRSNISYYWSPNMYTDDRSTFCIKRKPRT